MEYLRQCEKPINSDAFGRDDNNEEDELELANFTTHLRSHRIKSVIDKLNRLELLPTDSLSLEKVGR